MPTCPGACRSRPQWRGKLGAPVFGVEWSCSACGPFDAGTVGNLGTWLPRPCQHPSKLNVQSWKRGLLSLKITFRLGLAHSRPVQLEPSPVYQWEASMPPQSTYIYRAPQCMSPRWNWDSPTPLASSECALPPGPKGGGAHWPAAKGVGESQFQRLEKRLALCLLCVCRGWRNVDLLTGGRTSDGGILPPYLSFVGQMPLSWEGYIISSLVFNKHMRKVKPCMTIESGHKWMETLFFRRIWLGLNTMWVLLLLARCRMGPALVKTSLRSLIMDQRS